jgi:hypothetical protein
MADMLTAIAPRIILFFSVIVPVKGGKSKKIIPPGGTPAPYRY